MSAEPVSWSRESLLVAIQQIAAPHGLQAEILPDEIQSVGVGGDCRTYTLVVCLTGQFPGWEVLAEISNKISNNLPLNRVIYEVAKK